MRVLPCQCNAKERSYKYKHKKELKRSHDHISAKLRPGWSWGQIWTLWGPRGTHTPTEAGIKSMDSQWWGKSHKQTVSIEQAVNK